MKLRKLYIKNIASIEEATIDFEANPLKDTDVFLISGKTGSGKTTILDAICLALYNKTPRLATKSNQDKTPDSELNAQSPQQLLRKGTTEGEIKLWFQGNNQQEYLSRWEVWRAYKKLDGSFKKEWTLTDLNENIVLRNSEAASKIIDLAGLDFNQFTRTTMLAQGAFSKFLESDENEKALILSKITDRTDFEKISIKIFEIAKEKKTEWENACARAKDINVLPPGIIEEKQQLILNIESQLTSLNRTTEINRKIKQWIDDNKKFETDLKTAQESLQKVEKIITDEEFKSKQNLIRQWDFTEQARDFLLQIERAREAKARQLKIISSLESQFSRLLGKFNYSEVKAGEQLKEVDLLLSQFDREGIQRTEIRKKIEQQTDISLKLANAILLLESYIGQIKNFKESETELESLEKKIETEAEELKESNLRYKEAETDLQIRQSVYDAQKDTIDKFAKEVRRKLHVGDTCPVCRQKIMAPIVAEDIIDKMVKEAADRLDEAKKTFDTAIKSHNKLVAAFEIDSENHKKLAKKIAWDKEKIVSDQAKVSAVCKEFEIERLDNESLKKLAQLKQDNKNLLKKLKDLDNINETVKLLEIQLENRKQIRDSISDSLKHILDIYPKWIGLKATTQNQEPALKEVSDLIEKLAGSVKILSEDSKIEQDAESALKKWIADNREYNETIIKNLSDIKKPHIENLRQELLDLNNMLIEKRSVIKNIREKLLSHREEKPESVDDIDVEALIRQIESSSEKIKEMAIEKGKIEKELSDNAQSVKLKEELSEKADSLKKISDAWHRLNELVGSKDGKKFRTIALSYILVSLIEVANHYLKTLAPRYTLGNIPGKFSIYVEDAWQGFAKRSSATLSGGETFLISLALALALSDFGDKLTVDTLFIDEGFGTLSGEPLANAIETLRTLHKKSGRHVGVISHIDELREKIPVVIYVNQEGNNSASKISVSG